MIRTASVVGLAKLGAPTASVAYLLEPAVRPRLVPSN
jgi:hypothetical protein